MGSYSTLGLAALSLLTAGCSGDAANNAAPTAAAPGNAAAPAVAAAPDSLNGAWRVAFAEGGISYAGEFRPANGEGPMVLHYAYGGENRYIRQTCRMEGQADIRIACREAVNLSGNANYTPDTFAVRPDGDQRLTGATIIAGSTTTPTTFERGSDAAIPARAWTDAGRPSTHPGAPPEPTAGGDINTRLQALAARLRTELPIRNGPVAINQIDAVANRLIFHASLARDFDQADWARLDALLRRNTCSGNPAIILHSGGTVSFQVVDGAGEQRSIDILDC